MRVGGGLRPRMKKYAMWPLIGRKPQPRGRVDKVSRCRMVSGKTRTDTPITGTRIDISIRIDSDRRPSLTTIRIK